MGGRSEPVRAFPRQPTQDPQPPAAKTQSPQSLSDSPLRARGDGKCSRPRGHLRSRGVDVSASDAGRRRRPAPSGNFGANQVGALAAVLLGFGRSCEDLAGERLGTFKS